MTNNCVALALHGGAGPLRGRDYRRERVHMRGLIEVGRDALAAGACALDVVVETVAALEASGLYVAGRGASPNTAGRYELDAGLMEGQGQRAGAVAALEGFASPIRAARAVMETTPHVLFVGEGAAAIAARHGLERIADPGAWFTQAGGGAGKAGADLATGTVGAVARDAAGAVAAATSTAGIFGKPLGRVGDCPILGAGVWADQSVAVSCTGTGEMFLRAAAAAQVAFRVRLAGQSLAVAAACALDEVRSLGGEGGLIAVNAAGEVVMPYTSAGMKRAALHADGAITCEVF
jgi:isoaspartyl peptidase/L-asparaginase-like protein (Ntn-hydrolase superfamily)